MKSVKNILIFSRLIIIRYRFSGATNEAQANEIYAMVVVDKVYIQTRYIFRKQASEGIFWNSYKILMLKYVIKSFMFCIIFINSCTTNTRLFSLECCVLFTCKTGKIRNYKMYSTSDIWLCSNLLIHNTIFNNLLK